MSDDLRILHAMQAGCRALTLAGILLLVGCAATPVYTRQDVALAAQQNQLELLYKQIQADLAQVKPGTDEELALQTVQKDIGQRLAQPQQSVVESLRAEAAEKPLSLAQIDQLEDAADEIEKWQPERKQELQGLLNTERERTAQRLQVVSKELGGLPEGEAGRRNLLLREQGQLTGGKHGDSLQRQADEELDMLYRQGSEALDKKQLTVANELLQQVAIVDPEYKSLAYKQELVATGLFEQRFWQALVDSKPEQAYDLFREFSETMAFATNREQISKDALELAQYFEALGEKQMRQKRWLESYDAFARSAYIRTRLESPEASARGLGNFVREMENRFKRARRGGQAEAALAYASIIERLQPQHALVTAEGPATLDTIHERAVAKVSVGPFAGAYGQQLGREVSRFLTSAAPNKVRLVDRVTLRTDAGDDNKGHAFLVLEGETVRANVETTEHARSETRTVVTATESGPNPLYRVWRELPRDERKEAEEPPKTAQLPVYEDVVVNHRDITIEAVLAVKYQLLDAAADKVIEGDTLSDTVTAKSTATPGMRQGMFIQQAIAASLPAEAEMYNQLTEGLSEEMGRRLVTQLLELDTQYASAARQFQQESKYSAATEQWAYAYAVSDPDSEERERYRSAMEHAVLAK